MRLHRRLRRLPRRVPRQRAARTRSQTYEKVYPFGWLGVLADVPPVSHELIYAEPRARLRAVQHAHRRRAAATTCSARSTTRSSDWSDDAFWDELRARLDRPKPRRSAGHRPVDRKEHRAAAQLRRRADALRPPVPGRRRRAHRAADRRQGPEPGGQRRRATCRTRLIEHYREQQRRRHRHATRERCLRRIWRAERFSWWFTSLMHNFPETGEFGQKMQARRARLPGALRRAASTALAENYVGLPL